eukprot:TRINITY_DN36959_c0_g1_i1.p1 TRINITY_DN36959_c0_g1~~TRINITY_DN36959_c0_g1_i1.p1  ORF type:complete len:604 (+),score=64.71 TRINITY_DN36959_c0_g1_i1:100-1911(+)
MSSSVQPFRPEAVVPADVIGKPEDKPPPIQGWQADQNGSTDSAGLSLCQRMRRSYRRLDLRFYRRDDEQAFKESLEPEILKHGCLVSLAGVAIIPLALVPVFVRETSSTRNPLKYGTGDVREILFWIWMLVLVTNLAYCVMSFLRMWKGWFSKVNWELFFMAVVTFYILSLSLVNFWHFPLMLGYEPSTVWQHDARGTEVFILLAIDGTFTAVAMYVPVRSCVMWILPFVGVGCYVCMLTIIDSVFPNDKHLTIGAFLLLSFFSQHGAFQDEQRRRENFEAYQHILRTEEVVVEQHHKIEDTFALVAGLRGVATSLCDFLLDLSSDLKISHAEKMHAAFFERESIEGIRFTELLNVDDTLRFEKLVSLVSKQHVPACLPVTVGRLQTICECHLLLVDTGRREPRFLLGIRLEREDIRSLKVEPFNSAGTASVDMSNVVSISHNFDADGSRFLGPADDSSYMPDALPDSLGLVPAVNVSSRVPQNSWVNEMISQDPDISFTTYPKQSPPPPPGVTSVKARALSLKKLMPRWNIARDADCCCQFHTVVMSVLPVLEYLREEPCDPLWSPVGPAQCPRCKCMCSDFGQRCAVCGFQSQPSDSRDLT